MSKMPYLKMKNKVSFKARLYFSPLCYLIHFVLKLLSFCGKKCIVYGYKNRDGKFLKKCRIASTAEISDRNKLVIGDNVWINHYVRVDTSGGVEIGEGCQVGYGTCILSHSSHIAIRLCGEQYMTLDPENRPGYILKSVKIGPYSFIGGGCYIMPGVTIGKGCVVGVNSVVTKDVPDYAIIVGSPAKIIGSTLEIDKHYINDMNIKDIYYDKNVCELL